MPVVRDGTLMSRQAQSLLANRRIPFASIKIAVFRPACSELSSSSLGRHREISASTSHVASREGTRQQHSPVSKITPLLLLGLVLKRIPVDVVHTVCDEASPIR